ncbi:hypothetical protein DVH24_008428 [Malus domestica]|uniref:Uncharacterized protein n=1 Tax=Malus domestica TaxID=3750 RepID=A0A498JJM6_MALDO|nr:hypothetical protein DVH24_008428 [Malus domestica]
MGNYSTRMKYQTSEILDHSTSLSPFLSLCLSDCSFISHHRDPTGYPDLFTQTTNPSLYRFVAVHGLISTSLVVHHRKFKNPGDPFRQNSNRHLNLPLPYTRDRRFSPNVLRYFSPATPPPEHSHSIASNLGWYLVA